MRHRPASPARSDPVSPPFRHPVATRFLIGRHHRSPRGVRLSRRSWPERAPWINLSGASSLLVLPRALRGQTNRKGERSSIGRWGPGAFPTGIELVHYGAGNLLYDPRLLRRQVLPPPTWHGLAARPV